MSSVLITGGTGFIGFHLTKKLLADGRDVVIFDHSDISKKEYFNEVRDNVTLIQGDVRNPVDLERCFKHPIREVVHLAGRSSVVNSIHDPISSSDTNIGGTIKLLHFAHVHSVCRFVFASSAGVYGDAGEKALCESMQLDPHSPHGLERQVGEQYLSLWMKLHKLSSIALRLFNVYGKHNDSNDACVPSRFVNMIKSDRRPYLTGDGSHTRDFVHVSDAVLAIMASLNLPQEAGYQSINIGTGSSHSIKEVLDIVCDIAGVHYIPEHRTPIADEVKNSRADISKARDILGWSPRVSLEEGISLTF
jgi:UDP-glucose 4-epimerase